MDNKTLFYQEFEDISGLSVSNDLNRASQRINHTHPTPDY